MPKEQVRKRGKRKPKQTEEHSARANNFTEEQGLAEQHSNDAGPSSIHPARAAMLAGRRPAQQYQTTATEHNEEEQTLEWGRDLREAEYPFGELDPDVKAYFRNVDDQIRDWEGVSSAGEEREDRQTFLNNVLAELRGNELAVATDPDTAVVLERLMPSLGDWGRRVIGDSFGDQWEILMRHRFGSHVAQTWFTLAANTLDREARDIFPPQQNQSKSKLKAPETGSLPTMTALFTSLLTLLQPLIPSLLTNPHASPPLRLLLLVCTPGRDIPSLTAPEGKKQTSLIRSKKSGQYRKGHGVQGKSIFADDHKLEKGQEMVPRSVPPDLVELRKKITSELLDVVSPVEWRSMGVNEVGSAAVQLLLSLEIEDGNSMKEGSLLDHLTESLVFGLESVPRPKEYLTSLLTFPVGSHLFESLLTISPLPVYHALWTIYFVGKIGKLAVHPYGNFVVAAGISRLEADGLEDVVQECRAISGGRSLIKLGRTSVLQALVARAQDVPDAAASVVQLIGSGLDLPEKDTKPLIPCLMALKTYPIVKAIQAGEEAPVEVKEENLPDEIADANAEEAAAAAAKLEGWKNRRNPKPRGSDLAPNMQGSLLLQALVRLPKQNEVVINSFLAQPSPTLLEYTSSPISSRLLDAILDSPAVAPKDRRRIIMAYLPNFAELAMDKIGSYIAESMWSKADGYMKERIAKTLLPRAIDLASSQYGRFLAGKLDLQLLSRRPIEWRQKHIEIARHKPQIVQDGPASTEEQDKIKRRREDKDEIDELFAKKSKIAA